MFWTGCRAKLSFSPARAGQFRAGARAGASVRVGATTATVNMAVVVAFVMFVSSTVCTISVTIAMIMATANAMAVASPMLESNLSESPPLWRKPARFKKEDTRETLGLAAELLVGGGQSARAS